jgi:hypothetical protein
MTDKFTLGPTAQSNEMERVREASRRLRAILEEHCPPGLGFVLVVFESPMSLRRPQVALTSDHDAASVERVLTGILDEVRRRGRG